MSTTARHRLLQELFSKACDLSDDTRHAWLDEHCPPEMRSELEKLAHWGIDVDAAVAVVDPKQCRYKIENLTVGI